jgi:hypothetical protein
MHRFLPWYRVGCYTMLYEGGGNVWVPGLFPRTYNLHGNCLNVQLYSISFFRSSNGVEILVFTFGRSIRAEVVTYRLDVAFGFLHTQQLHDFDESRNNHGIIQNLSSKINTIAASFYLPASYLSFRILRLAQKKRANGKWQKLCVFLPFGCRSR